MAATEGGRTRRGLICTPLYVRHFRHRPQVGTVPFVARPWRLLIHTSRGPETDRKNPCLFGSRGGSAKPLVMPQCGGHHHWLPTQACSLFVRALPRSAFRPTVRPLTNGRRGVIRADRRSPRRPLDVQAEVPSPQCDLRRTRAPLGITPQRGPRVTQMLITPPEWATGDSDATQRGIPQRPR